MSLAQIIAAEGGAAKPAPVVVRLLGLDFWGRTPYM